MLTQCNLKQITREALKSIDPVRILSAPKPGQAVLCWGKAALRSWQAVSSQCLSGVRPQALVIAPEGSGNGARASFEGAQVFYGEHPLPGPGSFAAGAALIDFFDALGRSQAQGLKVYLSGGASSLAWLPPAHLSRAQLEEELIGLYSGPWTIQELNRMRSQLCALKGGGAARWCRALAGNLPIEVEVISDVSPYGVEVVGSGPFFDGKTPHRSVGDNATLVGAVANEAKRLSLPILYQKHSASGLWEQWVEKLSRLAQNGLVRNQSGLIIMGGEPQVELPKVSIGSGRGGRLTQIALALSLKFSDELANGRLQWICASSDGVDGRSQSAGAFLNRSFGARLKVGSFKKECQKSLSHFSSALPLASHGALIPQKYTGTNVQDVVILSLSL